MPCHLAGDDDPCPAATRGAGAARKGEGPPSPLAPSSHPQSTCRTLLPSRWEQFSSHRLTKPLAVGGAEVQGRQWPNYLFAVRRYPRPATKKWTL